MPIYQIRHKTTYTYNQPVFLEPHLVRLRPLCNGWQKLVNFALEVAPEPTEMAPIRDLDGNSFIQIWFNHSSPTEKFSIETQATVETYITNPFNYLLEPWALKLPFNYPVPLLNQLQPYLIPYSTTADPVAIRLAQDIAHEVEGNPSLFLTTLNQKIYNRCKHVFRDQGEPWQPGITWRSKKGSCRDVAVLFMDVCRAIGLGARFVSGYQEGDPDQQQREMHAWVEVYLPGCGWRGFDPSHGLVVSDRHIALAASSYPDYASPILGKVTPAKSPRETSQPVESQMEVHLAIEISS